MFEIASPASLILNKYSRGHVFDFLGSGVEIPTGFEEKYDFHTFTYHAYWNTAGDKAILICPPFGNFRDAVKLGDRKIALTDADSEYLTVHKYPRYYRVEVAEELLDARGQLPVYVNDSEAYSLKIQDNISDDFRDLKILHTLQKDNNLEWIYDWVKYYISVHEIDAVVIFDNGSTKYSIEEIKETVISAGNGKLKKVIIFDWDFPYGPAMSPWTSFFLQPSTFAVAHEYIYQYADFVVNTDIDEYILESDTSFSQALDESGTGSLVIHGHWIENTPLPGAHLEESSSPRVWQFGYFNPTRLNSGKWVSRPKDLNDPNVHFSEHWISGRSLTADPRFRVAHFAALTSGWFDPSRKDQMQLDDTLRIDPLLIKSLEKAFPEKMPESTYTDSIHQVYPKYIEDAYRQKTMYAKGYLDGKLSEFQWKLNFINKNNFVVLRTENTLPTGENLTFYVRTVPFVRKLDLRLMFSTIESAELFREFLVAFNFEVIRTTHEGRGLALYIEYYDKDNYESSIQNMGDIIYKIIIQAFS